METASERFLRYISYDTQSIEAVDQIPSTSTQFLLANLLADELRVMGAEDVFVDGHCYVYATIPATTSKAVPVLGFIAHMDTAPSFSGADVQPRVVKNYDGTDILLNKEKQISMKTSDFPDLLHYVGQDLIVTDGTTLLGADDKAGIAEIMTMADYLLKNPLVQHGTIKIAFTPDEEVGRGADLFDVRRFGADVAFTVDGGALGEIEFENFNAAGAKVIIHGANIHPGTAKGKMKNALLMGMEFQAMLPVFDNPMYTENYEGFYHLDSMAGSVEEAVLNYIIRDHNMELFEQKKELMRSTADFLNKKYGDNSIELVMKDSYYNMIEKVRPHQYIIDVAKEAMEELKITPKVQPIRGGTDGARLSFMGLPCPNLCAGGHNFHGKYEFISIQTMERIVELLIKVTEKLENR